MLAENNHKVKRALISVSDKTGLVEFAKALSELGVEIFSTGGTKKALSDANVPVKSVSELTGYPEILGGRVKTLNPVVHAGLLADLGNPDHIKQMEEHNLQSIDIVAVNLYPFEKTLQNENSTHQDLIENIDIGGPAMLRASAKNYKWTAVVVNPDNYENVINHLKESGTIPEEFRAKLAAEVFTHTASYDTMIAGYFNNYCEVKAPAKLNMSFPLAQDLRYGENPHQKASLYGNFNEIFEKLHGKELSFNNILDINAASGLILEFDEPALAIIKHTNPCGVALGADLAEAFQKAFATDNVSPFGGIIAVNRAMDLRSAEAMHSLFAEVIVAPDFTDEALALLTKKKDRRLIKVDLAKLDASIKLDFRSVAGGLLLQDADRIGLNKDEMKVVTKRQPTEDEMKALAFAWKICKHVKSNAIVYTSSDRTLAVGAGQMSRVDSSRIAVEKAKLNDLDLKGSVIASDAFFPFGDGVQQAAEAGATAIIQPGGSVRDEEVIKVADEYGMAMVFTGIRHFKH